MATKKETIDATSMNVFAKLCLAREMFLNSNVKKTGVNRYAEFKYFTLEDIIPEKQRIFKELGLVDTISFTDTNAVLTLHNTDNPGESIEFTSPTEDDESLIKNPIQKLGAVETYVRRYLYMLMLDIVESDTVDAVSGKTDPDTGKAAEPKKSNRPATPEQREEVKKDLINEGGDATSTQIKAIKNGLKKLREKDAEKYETYVTNSVKKIKAGLKKTAAEELLIEIGKKVEE